jgi:hypothetical protein
MLQDSNGGTRLWWFVHRLVLLRLIQGGTDYNALNQSSMSERYRATRDTFISKLARVIRVLGWIQGFPLG